MDLPTLRPPSRPLAAALRPGRHRRWLLAGCAFLSFSAFAQWLGQDYAVYGAPLSNYMAGSFLNQTYMNQMSARRATGTSGSPSRPASTVAPQTDRSAASARELAAALPAERREKMQQVYQQALGTYRQLEAQLGTPANDVAGAVAAFIVGNYMAYRNVEVPDAHYRHVVEQMRGALGTNTAFANARPADKRKLYEQMAMVGTFMAVARQSFLQNPNPGAEKNYRDSAAANLESALKVSADRVRITERGLTLQ